MNAKSHCKFKTEIELSDPVQPLLIYLTHLSSRMALLSRLHGFDDFIYFIPITYVAPPKSIVLLVRDL